jgi:hypothetical protein
MGRPQEYCPVVRHCARAYQRARDWSRKRFHSAVIERVLIRDGHIAEAQYKEPLNGFFAEPKFEYEDFGGR